MSVLNAELSLDASMRHAIAPVVQRPTPTQNQRSMWQREMERAETEAWFRQPAEPTTQTTAGAVTSDEHPGRAVQPSVLGREADVSSTRGKSLVVERDRIGMATHCASGAPSSVDLRSSKSSVAGRAPAGVDTGSTANGAITRAPALVPQGNSVAVITVAAGRVGEPMAASPMPEQARPVDVLSAGKPAVAAARLPSTGSASSVEVGASASPAELSPSPLVRTEAEPRPDGLPAISDAVVDPGDCAPVHRAMKAAMDSMPGLRMHVEWTDGAAAIWVGIDRAAETTLPELIARLSETLSRNGLCLRSVVCNGTRRFQSLAPSAGAEPHGRPVDLFMESES